MLKSYTPIKKIGQIYAEMKSIGDVNKLYYLFADTLRFPEAWPPKDRKTYYGGGVYTGNTWLKWTTPNLRNYDITDKPARFSFIVAEPTDYSKSLREIENRGIKHGAETIHTSLGPSGQETEWCRSVGLTDYPFSNVGLGLASYSPFAFSEHTSTPDASDLSEHYRILRGRLDEAGGGPLGVRYVKEVELGTENLRDCTSRWQTLLDPIKPVGEACWSMGKGPMVRLTSDSVNRIRSVTFRVRSIRRARMRLKGLGLLGESRGDTITISLDKVNGLEFKMTK